MPDQTVFLFFVVSGEPLVESSSPEAGEFISDSIRDFHRALELIRLLDGTLLIAHSIPQLFTKIFSTNYSIYSNFKTCVSTR